MSQFNIQNSKVEQFADSGNNYKITGHNTISQNGNIVSATGNQNKLLVDRKENLLSQLWNWLKAGVRRLFGRAG
jgi:hypothetical protein